MKNIIKYTSVLFLFFWANSCTEDFQPLFEENASQRFQTVKNEYSKALTSAEKGWLLQYFPHEEQKYGGYNFYLNFLDETQVDAKSIDSAKWVNSNYSLKQSGGLILSLDIFNPILHEYANPSSSFYKGKGGDYEFLVISNENDVITLKGTKTGNYLKMIKMKETQEEYNYKVKAVKKYLDKLNYPLKGKVGGTEAVLDAGGGNNFILNYTEGGELKSEKIPFIYTDKGVLFYEPVTINGKEYSELIFNKQENRLYSEDGVIDINLTYILVNFNVTAWTLDIAIEETRSAKMQKAWDGDNLINALVLGKKYDLHTNYTIGREDGKVGIFSYLTEVASGSSFGIGGLALQFDIDKDDDTVIHITKGEPYEFEQYYKYVSNVNDMITQNSPYKIELDDNSTDVKLTSTTDPEVWFILKKQDN